MKIPAFIKDLFAGFAAAHDSVEEPGSDIIYVEPNDRGGFSLRGKDDSEATGNYPTAEDAMRIARANGHTPTLRLDPPGGRGSNGVLKYVVICDRKGIEQILFCVAPLTHYELATAFMRPGSEAISAGFVEFTPDGPRAFGRSESLKVDARPNDSRLIAAFYRVTAITAPERKPFKPSHGLTHQSSLA